MERCRLWVCRRRRRCSRSPARHRRRPLACRQCLIAFLLRQPDSHPLKSDTPWQSQVLFNRGSLGLPALGVWSCSRKQPPLCHQHSPAEARPAAPPGDQKKGVHLYSMCSPNGCERAARGAGAGGPGEVQLASATPPPFSLMLVIRPQLPACREGLLHTGGAGGAIHRAQGKPDPEMFGDAARPALAGACGRAALELPRHPACR